MPPVNQPRQQSEFVKAFWENRAASRNKTSRRPPEETLKILQKSRGGEVTGTKPIDIRVEDVKAPPKQAGPPAPPVPSVQTYTPSAFVQRFNEYNKRMKKDLEKFNKEVVKADEKGQKILETRARDQEKQIINQVMNPNAPQPQAGPPVETQSGLVSPTISDVGQVGMGMIPEELKGAMESTFYNTGEQPSIDSAFQYIKNWADAPAAQLLIGPGSRNAPRMIANLIPGGAFLFEDEREKLAKAPWGEPSDYFRKFGFNLGEYGGMVPPELVEEQIAGRKEQKRDTKTGLLMEEAQTLAEWVLLGKVFKIPEIKNVMEANLGAVLRDTKVYKRIINTLMKLRGKVVGKNTPEAKAAVESLNNLLKNFAKAKQAGGAGGLQRGIEIGGKTPTGEPTVARIAKEGGKLVEKEKPGFQMTAEEVLSRKKPAEPGKITVTEPTKRPVEPVTKRTGRGVTEPVPETRAGFGPPETIAKTRLRTGERVLPGRTKPQPPSGVRATAAETAAQRATPSIVKPGDVTRQATPQELRKVGVQARAGINSVIEPKPTTPPKRTFPPEREIRTSEGVTIYGPTGKPIGKPTGGGGVTLEFGGLGRTGELLGEDLARFGRKAKEFAARTGLIYKGEEEGTHRFSLSKRNDVNLYVKTENATSDNIITGMMETLKKNNIKVKDALPESAINNIVKRAGAEPGGFWPEEMIGGKPSPTSGQYTWKSPWTGGNKTMDPYDLTPQKIKQVMLDNYKQAKLSGEPSAILKVWPEGEKYVIGKPVNKDGFYLDFMGTRTSYHKLLSLLRGGRERVKGWGKYARSVNLEKRSVSEEVKQFMAELGELSPKRYQSWDETGKLSKEIYTDLKRINRVFKKAEKGQGLNAQELGAINQVEVNAVSRLQEMAESLTNEELKPAFQSYVENLFRVTSDANSEAGRALNYLKKELTAKRIGDAWVKLGRNMNEREWEEFRRLNTEDPVQVKAFLERLGDPKLRDYFFEYWYNSILSGPPTHLVNIISNTGWAMFQLPHRVATGGIDRIISTLTGRAREVYAREIVPMMGGYATGFGKGASAAKEMMRTGQIQQWETKWVRDIGGTVIGAFERSPHARLRKIAPLVEVPTRALRAMDVWANSMAYDAQLRALAYRSGRQAGLKGDDLILHQWEFMEAPPKWAMLEASKFAKYSTFMDDPGKISSWLIQGRNKYQVSRLVVPFVNTLANLTKRGIEMTPGVGLTLARGQKPAEVIAKQIEGSILAFYIWQKAAAGEITGPAPEGEGESLAFYKAGKLPWSIKIGDTWYQYRRIEPFNTVIAMASIAYEQAMKAKDDITATEIFMNVVDGMADNLLDSTFLSGVNNILDRYGRRRGMVQRLAASVVVPASGFWRSMIRAYEVATEGKTLLRDTKSFLGAVSQNLPGVQEMAPPRLDVWGNEIEIPGGIARQWLPYKFREESKDPVDQGLFDMNEELRKAGEDTHYLGMPEKEIRGVKLTNDQYKKYVKIRGDFAYKRMKRIITGSGWPKMKPTVKRRIISKIWSAAGDFAKKEMLGKEKLLIKK